MTPLKSVRIVFLLPEPYMSPGMADGYALSCQPSFGDSYDPKIFPAMFNGIIEGLSGYFNCLFRPETTDLTSWAKQGILLWNSRPTTLVGHKNAHVNLRWHELTEEILKKTYEYNDGTIFVLFGDQCKVYEEIIPDGATVMTVPLPNTQNFVSTRLFETIDWLIQEVGSKRINWMIKKQ